MVECTQVLDARAGIAPQVVCVHPHADGCPSALAARPCELASVPRQITRELELEVTKTAEKVTLQEEGKNPASTVTDHRRVTEGSVEFRAPEQLLHRHAVVTRE